MTDDIVIRLREETCHMPECCWLFTDAADEIERLRGALVECESINSRLREQVRQLEAERDYWMRAARYE